MAEIDDTPVLDDAAWAHGERYWREVVEEILTSMGQAGEWPSWEPRFYGDGVTPIAREDRSICDGRSARLDRSFSINQFPVGEVPGIAAYVKDYATELLEFPDIDDIDAANRWFDEVPPHERVPRSTLILNLEYSEETSAAARLLLTEWLKPEMTVAGMRAFLDGAYGVEHW